MIEITIRGKPVAWARANRGGNITFTPDKQRQAMHLIGYEAMAVMGNRPLLQGPLRLQLVFTYAWPNKTPKKLLNDPIARYRCSQPDLDNLTKLVCDSLNNVVWKDDAQVVSTTATKVYGPIPSVSILVFEIANESSGTVVPLCVA